MYVYIYIYIHTYDADQSRGMTAIGAAKTNRESSGQTIDTYMSNTYIYIYIYRDMYNTCVCIYIYICIHTYIYIYIYIYIHTYVHTYIHTYTHVDIKIHGESPRGDSARSEGGASRDIKWNQSLSKINIQNII